MDSLDADKNGLEISRIDFLVCAAPIVLIGLAGDGLRLGSIERWLIVSAFLAFPAVLRCQSIGVPAAWSLALLVPGPNVLLLIACLVLPEAFASTRKFDVGIIIAVIVIGIPLWIFGGIWYRDRQFSRPLPRKGGVDRGPGNSASAFRAISSCFDNLPADVGQAPPAALSEGARLFTPSGKA